MQIPTRKNRLSINDIANRLNISKTTVSFILNGKAKEKRISDQLTQRVLALVEEVGYRPNHLAQSLRTGKTKILGLMVEDISNAFFAGIAKIIEDTASRFGYRIIYCSTENKKERTQEFLNMFDIMGVDGYIITPPGNIEPDLKRLIEKGKEVVLFDRHFTDVATDYVVVNNQESTYNGTQHLVHQGYKNIAFITLHSDQSQMEARLKGYQQAIQEHRLAEQVCKLPYLSLNYESYVQRIIQFLNESSEIDALLFGTNYIGISGLEALARLKVDIPNQMAVMSFDDTDLFRIHRPSITAIAQPLETIAQTIISTLIDNIDSPHPVLQRKCVTLSATLQIRESTPRKMS